MLISFFFNLRKRLAPMFMLLKWICYQHCQALHQLNWAFFSAGLAPFLPGAMLSLFRQNYGQPFSPRSDELNLFVQTFFDHLQQTLTESQFRFGFLVTLLGFLNVYSSILHSFNLFTLFVKIWLILLRIKRSEVAVKDPDDFWNSPGCLQITYQMPNVWLGVLYASYPAPRSLQFPQDGAFLLTFMCHILIMSLTGRAAK